LSYIGYEHRLGACSLYDRPSAKWFSGDLCVKRWLGKYGSESTRHGYSYALYGWMC